MEKFLDTPVKRYSIGMYVRLAFSVAAHLGSDILIVDEVLAAGDAGFQKRCMGRMESVVRRQGGTDDSVRQSQHGGHWSALLPCCATRKRGKSARRQAGGHHQRLSGRQGRAAATCSWRTTPAPARPRWPKRWHAASTRSSSASSSPTGSHLPADRRGRFWPGHAAHYCFSDLRPDSRFA